MSASGTKRGRDGARTLAAVRSLVVLGTLALTSGATAETWRGLEVAPEHRCSPYDKKRDYPYPQSVERDIVRGLGAVYGPYTGTCFGSTRDTDIEHIVAASDAHDSGLCGRGRRGGIAIRLPMKGRKIDPDYVRSSASGCRAALAGVQAAAGRPFRLD